MLHKFPYLFGLRTLVLPDPPIGPFINVDTYIGAVWFRDLLALLGGYPTTSKQSQVST